MTGSDVVSAYFKHNLSPIFWTVNGDNKGPHESGWPKKVYTFEDYAEGKRVGLRTGIEVEPGKFLHDVDIDWEPGTKIALAFLPPTGFVYGRTSKQISHCFYLLPEPLFTKPYKDIGEGKNPDGITFIELRGTKADGDIGLQSMVPPSVWSKNGTKEPLTFVSAKAGPLPDAPFGEIAYIEALSAFKQRVCLSAIGMLLAKHFGFNGFGHDARLAWAGFLLRAGIEVEHLVTMGTAISQYCNNREVQDVRRVVESTAAALSQSGKKVKGGPALAKILGENGKKIVARINEWIGRDSDFIRDKEGAIIRDNQDNVHRALRMLDIGLAYHQFNEKVIVTTPTGSAPLDDAFVKGTWLRIDREFRFKPTFSTFEMIIEDVARSSPYHAVKEYLDGLTWDGVPRLDTWLTRLGGAAGDEYTHTVGAIVLIAAVRRVKQPGCKYDEIMVLESGQGMNKSSALRALCADEAWFSDDLPLNIDSKQIIERTLGKWIIEASDLTGNSKAEREHLKSMLSRQIDGPARMAYAHHPIERPRQFILIGTTNAKFYLADPTGARRFWPVPVNGFNIPALLNERDQLWAEAVQREAQGASIRLPEPLWPAAAKRQEQRQAPDAWEDILRTAALAILPNGDGLRRVACSSLWDVLGVENSRRDRAGSMRMSDCMHKLGFKNTVVRIQGGDPERGYVTEDETKLAIHAEDDHVTLLPREPGSDDDVPF